MELVLGSDGEPAPRLIDVDLEPAQAEMRRTWTCFLCLSSLRILSCDLIHWGSLAVQRSLERARPHHHQFPPDRVRLPEQATPSSSSTRRRREHPTPAASSRSVRACGRAAGTHTRSLREPTFVASSSLDFFARWAPAPHRIRATRRGEILRARADGDRGPRPGIRVSLRRWPGRSRAAAHLPEGARASAERGRIQPRGPQNQQNGRQRAARRINFVIRCISRTAVPREFSHRRRASASRGRSWAAAGRQSHEPRRAASCSGRKARFGTQGPS